MPARSSHCTAEGLPLPPVQGKGQYPDEAESGDLPRIVLMGSQVSVHIHDVGTFYFFRR